MFTERTFYDNAYVINLRRRVDRWAVTQGHLRSIGFRPTRYEAVDGGTIPDTFVGLFTTPKARESISRGYRHEHHEISRGSVGCSLSHFALWRILLDSDKDHMTIFEDDAQCVRPAALKKLPFGHASFDVLLLGGLYDSKENSALEEAKAGISIQPVQRFLCTHAYVIWKEAAWKLLQYAFPIQKQVDFYMHALPSLQLRACLPTIFTQNQDIAHTDVQIPIEDSERAGRIRRAVVVLITIWLPVCLLVIYLHQSGSLTIK
jgi:GR25 family glycosyltransferase involved in LPS biosynthesis